MSHSSAATKAEVDPLVAPRAEARRDGAQHTDASSTASLLVGARPRQTMTPGGLMAVQRTAGNRAAAALVRRGATGRGTPVQRRVVEGGEFPPRDLDIESSPDVGEEADALAATGDVPDVEQDAAGAQPPPDAGPPDAGPPDAGADVAATAEVTEPPTLDEVTAHEQAEEERPSDLDAEDLDADDLGADLGTPLTDLGGATSDLATPLADLGGELPGGEASSLLGDALSGGLPGGAATAAAGQLEAAPSDTTAALDVGTLPEVENLDGGLVVGRFLEEGADRSPQLDDVDVDTLPTEPALDGQDPGAITASATGMSAAQPPSGGGLWERAKELAVRSLRSVVGWATGFVRSEASGVADTAGGYRTSATSTLGGLFGGIRSFVASTLGSARSGLSALVSGGRGLLRTGLTAATTGVRGLMRTLAGPIRNAVWSWIRSGGSGSPVDRVLTLVRTAISGIVESVRATAQRVAESISAFVTWITDAVAQATSRIAELAQRALQAVSDALRAAITAITRTVTRIAEAIAERARRLPSIIRSFVNRLLQVARTVVDAITGAARRFVDWVAAAARRLVDAAVQLAQQLVRAVVDGVRNLVAGLRALLNRVIDAVLEAIRAAVRAVANFLRRLVARALVALFALVAKLIEWWLGDQIRQVLADIVELTPEALGALSRCITDIPDVMRMDLRQGASRMTRDVPRAIMRPDGDVFSIGGTAGVSAGAGVKAFVGGGINLTYTYDFVASYRTNEIGIWINVSWAPYLTAGVGAGGGASAEIGVTGGYGPALSFGDAPTLSEAMAPPSVGVSLGVGAQAKAGVGVSVGSGNTVSTSATAEQWADYMSGGTPATPGVPSTPGTPGTPAVPGTPGTPPTPAAPGTPGSPGTPAGPPTLGRPRPVAATSVLFQSGQDALTGPQSLPGQRERVRDLADQGGRESARHPGSELDVGVTGHASRRWRVVREGQSAAGNNEQLSQRRAANARTAVEEDLSNSSAGTYRVGPAVGAGHPSNRPEDDNRQEDRRADLSMQIREPEEQPGVPSTPPTPPTPGEPGQPGTPDVPAQPGLPPTPAVPGTPGSRPVLPALTWMTTMSAAVAAGVDAKGAAGVTAGCVGSATKVLWGPKTLSPLVMKGLRVLLTLVKVGLSFAGTVGQVPGASAALLRDAASVVGAVEGLIDVNLVDPMIDFVLPMPDAP